MKSLSIIISILILSFTGLSGRVIAQEVQKANNSVSSSIEVIQFHSEHRCMTCNKIESLARKTLDRSFLNLKFKLINVDDPANEKMAESFEAVGTALFIYDRTSGRKKDLTDFAFMNADNEEKFVAGLTKHIQQFNK